MKKEILIVLPSRSNGTGREKNIDRFVESWKYYTEGCSDLLISLDDDDEHYYPRKDGILYTVNPNERFVPKVNRAAFSNASDYKYIANFSDDFIIKNKWEGTFIEFFESNNKVGMAYGNDLLQSEKLPTAICMTSNIILSLGYMIPPQLLHMYADNFWLDLGNTTQTIKYFPDIIFEHIHPDARKAPRDAQYGYAAAVAGQDQHEYAIYLRSEQFLNDINKINKLKNNG